MANAPLSRSLRHAHASPRIEERTGTSRWFDVMALVCAIAVVSIAAPEFEPTTAPIAYVGPPVDAEYGFRAEFGAEGRLEGWRGSASVADLAVAGGHLSTRFVGADPQLLGPRVDIDAERYAYLGLRCRSNVDGLTQIYFGVAGVGGFSADRMITIPMARSDSFVTYELDLRDVSGWEGRVEELRIDPVNGADEVGADVEIDWIAVYRAPARLVPLVPRWAGADELVVGMENRGGTPLDAPIEYTWEGVLVGTIDELDVGASREIVLDAADRRGSFWIEAAIGGHAVWRGRLVRPVNVPAIDDPSHRAANEIRVHGGSGELRDAEGRSARLSPIASLTLRDPELGYTYYEFAPAPQLAGQSGTSAASNDAETGVQVLREDVVDPRGARITCTLRIEAGDVETTIESDVDLEVVRMDGPRLLQDGAATHALLPGLEYLENGEASSSSAWTGPLHADRRTPPAYRLTAPWAGFEYDRGTSSIASTSRTAWVASVDWSESAAKEAANGRAPGVEFCSREGSPSFVTVFLPARPYAGERADGRAREPDILARGTPLSLRARYSIDQGTIEDVFAHEWLARAPQPPSVGFITPEERRDDAPRPGPGSDEALEQVLATSMIAYTDALFDGVDSWKSHVSIGEPHARRPEFAAAIGAESARTGRDYMDRVCIDDNSSIEGLLGSAGAWISEKSYRAAVDALAAMDPQGGVSYGVTPQERKQIAAMTARHHATGSLLGVEGETNAGLIAEVALPLLQYAACTLDPVFVAAARRALARMNSFTVPRGSQSWEIDARTPDLYAAAQCALANIWGWRATGEDAFLDAAQRWLNTGLPFLYWWKPTTDSLVRSVHIADERGEGPNLDLRAPNPYYRDAEREVLPFASIPVFGTSWFAVPWFGIPVQWCGLAWANAVRELHAIRPIPEYIPVADGVFRSAANQLCDEGFLAGTLPDSWDLATNVSRQPFIVPARLVEYAYRCLGAPNPEGIEYRRLSAGEWTHVASRSILERVEQHPGRLSIASRYYEGQDASLVLGGRRVPLHSVRVDGHELTEGQGVDQYHWVDCGSDRAALVVRWRSRTTQRLEVEVVVDA